MPEEREQKAKSAHLHGASRRECAVGVKQRTESKKNGMNAIKVSVSSRHYNMKWAAEEIFGNWDMGKRRDASLKTQGGAEPDSVTFHKEGKKRALHLCRDLVRRHGYEQISYFLQRLEGLGVHNGENIEYPHNMTTGVRPQIFAGE